MKKKTISITYTTSGLDPVIMECERWVVDGEHLFLYDNHEVVAVFRGNWQTVVEVGTQ